MYTDRGEEKRGKNHSTNFVNVNILILILKIHLQDERKIFHIERQALQNYARAITWESYKRKEEKIGNALRQIIQDI